MIENQDLKARIRTGLLSFPVTPFGEDGAFAPAPFRAHLEWLSDHPVAGLIVAGGTGELFSAPWKNASSASVNAVAASRRTSETASSRDDVAASDGGGVAGGWFAAAATAS